MSRETRKDLAAVEPPSTVVREHRAAARAIAARELAAFVASGRFDARREELLEELAALAGGAAAEALADRALRVVQGVVDRDLAAEDLIADDHARDTPIMPPTYCPHCPHCQRPSRPHSRPLPVVPPRDDDDGGGETR